MARLKPTHSAKTKSLQIAYDKVYGKIQSQIEETGKVDGLLLQEKLDISKRLNESHLQDKDNLIKMRDELDEQYREFVCNRGTVRTVAVPTDQSPETKLADFDGNTTSTTQKK